jgi:ubiquinone/menaquinone biosynthesis C-methylase UbiE
MKETDFKQIVGSGYNSIAEAYLTERTAGGITPDILLLNELTERLLPGAHLLDAGCGAGVPVTQMLSRNFRVTGVDISVSQLVLARSYAPGAEFIEGDITRLTFPADSFDAIVSYYAIIHIPRAEHRLLLESFYRMVKQSGLVLLCLGANDLDDDIDEYHGVPMYWSHYDAETYRRMMEEIGFELIWARVVEDATSPGAGHLFVLGRK